MIRAVNVAGITVTHGTDPHPVDTLTTTVQPAPVLLSQQPRLTTPLPRQTTSLTEGQLAALKFRAQQLGIFGHFPGPHPQMHPQDVGSSGSLGPLNVPGRAMEPSVPSIARMNLQPSVANAFPQQHTVPYPSDWPAQPPAQASTSQIGTPAMANVPYDTLVRIINGMNSMQRTMDERLSKMEESLKRTDGIAERLERVETDLKTTREQTRQDSQNVVTYLGNMSRSISQRLEILGERIKRVESGLGPNYFEESSLPVDDESRLPGANKICAGNSVMEKLKNMECLLIELLEKADDPDANKRPIITHEIGINTESSEKAEAATQSSPPPETHEIAVGEELEYVDSGIDALPEVLNANAQGCARYDTLLMEYPTSSALGVLNHRPPVNLAANGSIPLQPGLQPATWCDDTLSDLSSRSTSPGMTVDELRRLYNQRQQAPIQPALQTFASSDHPPQPYMSSEYIYPPVPEAPPTPTSLTSGLGPNVPPPIVPSSRAVSILLDGSRGHSQSVESDDGRQRSSIDRLFDDDDDVAFATPSKSSETLEKSPEYVPAQEGPESEEELPDRAEVTQDPVQSSPFTSARVPARRHRSPSVDSLSSLSSLPSSPHTSSSRPHNHCHASSSVSSSRPHRKRRKTERARTSGKKSDARSVSTTQSAQADKSGKWEVLYGYNGPCKWPKIVDDETCRNLMKCDDCDCWYHWGCIGVDKNDPRASEEDVPFSCPPCEISKEMHGIARKVRHGSAGDECARPGCNLNLATGEFFLERIIGRFPHVGRPGEFIWLFKWSNYPPVEATWEPDTSFPADEEKYIEEFEESARDEDLPLDDPEARLLLREALDAGWS